MGPVNRRYQGSKKKKTTTDTEIYVGQRRVMKGSIYI